MNRAVEVKISNPDMSLVACLIAGGFRFPGLSEPGVKFSEARDTDNVTIYQRRNQLLRQVRLPFFLLAGQSFLTDSCTLVSCDSAGGCGS